MFEKMCQMGCVALEGNETIHVKDCDFYPESRTKMYDDLKKQNEELKEEIGFARKMNDGLRDETKELEKQILKARDIVSNIERAENDIESMCLFLQLKEILKQS